MLRAGRLLCARLTEWGGMFDRDMTVGRDMGTGRAGPRDGLADVSNEALVVLFANGDRAAARALTQRLAPRVLAHATRLLGNRTEAEDVAQEAMLRLWRVAPEWRQGEAKVTTWLYRVVANLCTDRLRKGWRLSALDAAEDAEDGQASAEGRLQEQARADALQAALNSLPERQREAVLLRHFEDLANPEIAQIMGISVEAVESLTARAKRALSAALAGRREDLGSLQ